jgi:TPP-dependent pyruvate/acetoin dehydrogenase alpha subunit
MNKELDRETARTIFEKMALIRAGEDRIMRGLSSGELAFGFYPIRGQEAIAATVGTVLRADDQITTTYRCFHDVIGKGIPMPQVLAEMMGKSTGTSKGKGGPMHLADPRRGLMLTTGIVGGGAPIAVGLALASALDGSGRVVVATFGDGATSIGATHESMNLAALWDLPLIFLCQNNGFGEHTPFAGYTRSQKLSSRADGYGMPGITVDGGSVRELHAALTDAIDRARDGHGPTFIEARTRRIFGHTFGADQPYRAKEELEQAQAAEPVGPYRRWLIEAAFADEAWLTEIEARAAETAEAAVAFAKESPATAAAERLTDVFATTSGA